MRRSLVVLAACLALVAAACGGEDGGTDAAATTRATVASAPGAADQAAPRRIVSLSPTATEILYAIGAGDQVVAVDDQSDHPAGAPRTDLSGFEPNLEVIASYDPDLVVTSFDPGELVAGLGGIGVPVLLQPPAATLADSWAQIRELGEATGHAEEAAKLVADLQERVDEVVAQAAPTATGEAPSVYHELDDTFYSAASSTFIGELYALLGLENIADAADTGGGYPQLAAEYIIEADPDLIVITDEVGYGPDDVAARPGWDATTAVAEGDIVQVDADLASRWGPRVVELLEVIAGHVAELEPGGS